MLISGKKLEITVTENKGGVGWQYACNEILALKYWYLTRKTTIRYSTIYFFLHKNPGWIYFNFQIAYITLKDVI